MSQDYTEDADTPNIYSIGEVEEIDFENSKEEVYVNSSKSELVNSMQNKIYAKFKMHVDYEDPIFTFMQSELEVVENLEVLIDTLLDQGAKISTQNKKIIETIISTMAKSTLINKKIDESSINLVQDINRVKKNIEITMGAQIAMIKSAAQLDEERIVKFLEKNEIKLKKNQDLERKNFAIYLVSISFASSFIASTIAFLLFK